ncbi:MAG: MBL fold metallo-hydrolase [Candidatus Thermoplasmatota archaeon]|nr:MBL fold metallo-hydrolase [Candidatus Thermoplasmatota archaeon]
MKISRILKGAGIRSSYGTMGAAGVVLVDDTKKILVDVGHFGNRDALLREMGKSQISPDQIDVVVLTHINWDHCLNVDLFQNAQIILGENELDRGTLSGIPDGLSPAFKEYLSTLKVKTVKDGYSITPNVSVIDTPGHTPGHIALSAVNNGFLTILTGDAVPNLRAYRRGVPDLAFHSEALARQSVSKIKGMKPGMIIPGHDAPFTDDGYTEIDNVDIILREEQEVNTVISVGKVTSDRPVVFHA